MTDRALYDLRQSIKKDSWNWYNTLRQGKYEYLYEFKSRIEEIESLQKMHHEIINSDKEPTPVKQASMNGLHKLNITLSNYIEVIPTVINGCTISTTPEVKTAEPEESDQSIITV